MNTLVIGAGAVGQVFARHLHLGGSNISFFARSERASRLRQGLVFYHLNRHDARRRPIHFEAFDVLTEYSQIGSRIWDQIYFCVPSNALRGGLLKQIGQRSGDATIIKLQPGIGDQRLFTEHFEESRLVTGMVSFVSYAAPLPQEKVIPPGMAYWFPPLLKSRFSRSRDRVQEVVKVLKDGGLPAQVHPDVEPLVTFMLAVQAPLTAGLECSGWSFEQFRRSHLLKVACRAIKQATAIVANYLQSEPPRFMGALNCSLIRLGFSILPRRFPFDLELYLAAHYAKLHEQSCQHLDEYIEQATIAGLALDSLQELRQRLDAS